MVLPTHPSLRLNFAQGFKLSLIPRKGEEKREKEKGGRWRGEAEILEMCQRRYHRWKRVLKSRGLCSAPMLAEVLGKI